MCTTKELPFSLEMSRGGYSVYHPDDLIGWEEKQLRQDSWIYLLCI